MNVWIRREKGLSRASLPFGLDRDHWCVFTLLVSCVCRYVYKKTRHGCGRERPLWTARTQLAVPHSVPRNSSEVTCSQSCFPGWPYHICMLANSSWEPGLLLFCWVSFKKKPWLTSHILQTWAILTAVHFWKQSSERGKRPPPLNSPWIKRMGISTVILNYQSNYLKHPPRVVFTLKSADVRSVFSPFQFLWSQ